MYLQVGNSACVAASFLRDDDGGRGFQKLHCHTLSSLPMSTLAISVQRKKKERGSPSSEKVST